MESQAAFLLLFAVCWALSVGTPQRACRWRIGGWLKACLAMEAEAGRSPSTRPADAGEAPELQRLRARVPALEAVVSEREYELNEKLRRL